MRHTLMSTSSCHAFLPLHLSSILHTHSHHHIHDHPQHLFFTTFNRLCFQTIVECMRHGRRRRGAIELQGATIVNDMKEDSFSGSNDESTAATISTHTEVESPSESKMHIFEEFMKHVQPQQLKINDLGSLFDFPMDRFQQLAVEAFLKGSSIVVCAPTSSGKTLIAEAAAAATLASGKRLFYTTPLKALSNQKLRDFRKMFGEVNVGLVTGDAAVNRDAPILIMTTEILRNMLYRSVGIVSEGAQLPNVHVIVLDEVHYLSDISRGTVWEETVIYCPKTVQLICLSATVSNPEELAGWISEVHGPTELVTSKRRPVPLMWHFSTRSSLLPLLNEHATAMNRRLSLERFKNNPTTILASKKVDGAKKRPSKRNTHKSKENVWRDQLLSEEEMQDYYRRQVPLVKDTLMQLKSQGMLPVIWFIFSRKGCDTAVQYVQHIQLLTEDEQEEVHEAVEKFEAEFPDAVRESAVLALIQGFAAHHAGCLPLWKSFIEELFQRGLVKVMFATETLAAGINMPARATVLSSLSKRSDTGHSILSPNSVLQMAGRAGRRGIDDTGHVVVVQTPFTGAEECCKLFFAGLDPLVSQFTASYGMALNLLAGSRIRNNISSTNEKLAKHGRTLEEARALIEQSFGNYLGTNVISTAKQKLVDIEEEIEKLKSQWLPTKEYGISKAEYDEYLRLKGRVRQERCSLKELQSKLELQRLKYLELSLDSSFNEHLPFICLSYLDPYSGTDIHVSAVCLDILRWHSFSTEEMLICPVDDTFNDDFGNMRPTTHDMRLFVALGSDNMWYMFTERSIKKVYLNGLPNALPGLNGVPSRDFLLQNLPDFSSSWCNVRNCSSDLSSIWCLEGSLEMLSISTNVPSDNDSADALQTPHDLLEAELIYLKRRKLVSSLRKRLKKIKANRKFSKILEFQKLLEAKITHLEEKKARINSRISRMQPSGWKEFLQVVRVLEDADAVMKGTHRLLSLGETAAGLRGENELWLAVAFSHSLFITLGPSQLAAVCGSLVSEGLKLRSDFNSSGIYNVSETVEAALLSLEERRQWLLGLQTKHFVEIPCELDDRFAGLVEAWASGVTWKELMMDCVLDEGDVARLLRRSIDLLAQIPFLEHLNPAVKKNARIAAALMDRSPISELVM